MPAIRDVFYRGAARPADLRLSGFACLAAIAILAIVCAQWVRAQDAAAAVGTPDADIGFVGLHGGVYELIEPEAARLKIRVKYFDDADIAERQVDFGSVRVLYLQHIRQEQRDAYRALIADARRRNPDLKIIAFEARGTQFLREVADDGAITEDLQAPKYYGKSAENLRRLLTYTGATYLQMPFKVEPPQDVQAEGLFHPDHAELFPTVDAFLEWRRTRGPVADQQPRVLVTVHATHLAFQQPKVVEALVREAEKQGALAVAIIDGRSKTYVDQARAFRPDVLIHTCHSTDALPLRIDLDVPHLHSIFFRKQSIDEWLKSPIGLASNEVAFQIIGQELIGAIEPQAVAGTRSGGGGAEAFQPVPERVEHLVRRAMSYAKLRSTPTAQKKVAIVYYDREMGKGELMRGSSTGMHMNAPRSVLAVLAKMKEKGYALRNVPETEDALMAALMERGRLVGVWAPGELDKLVRTGSPVLIPEQQYKAWLEKRVPPERRAQLEEKWGPAPGNFMVWQDADGRKFIVVPRVDLGNVILLPQPLRGEAHGKEALNSQAHDKTTAPPHNYLATYFWLEEQFGANAVVHFGTHGSEFALPGKATGLSNYDWPDIVMGAMPNFNPWIIENMVESAPVRRRVYGTLISHLPPPIVNAGLSDELATLHETIDKWELMEEGALRDRFAAEIGRQVRAARLDVDLHLAIPPDGKLDAQTIDKVNDYLHTIMEETTPTSLHVFGQPPRADLLPAYMVNVLRTPFLRALDELVAGHSHGKSDAKADLHQEHDTSDDHAADHHHNTRPIAERLLKLVLIDRVPPLDAVSLVTGKPLEKLPEEIDRGLKLAMKMHADFARTTDEIDNLLKGLDGRFVPPGPGNNPIRNPNAVPTGRNMYLLNPDEVPMRPSWELGRKMAEDLVNRYRVQHDGAYPRKVGFDLRSSATFRDYGVMEAQILALMGVEPVWDEKNLVSDVRLIPREKLGRPRVDVFIAAGGWYESNLPGRLNIWDKAVRLVAAADEPDNPVFANSRALQQTLQAKGIAPEKAAALAPARIFGRAPGRESGSTLAYTVERSGDWEDREQIAREYLQSHKYVYTEGAWGEQATELYDAAIQGTHTVVRSWSDYMTSPLSSRYTWLHGGALALGVEYATGKRPEYVFSDVRDPDKASLVKAEDALQQEYRVRLYNRKWLEAMMKEGYAGADHMRFLVSNSFGWEVMRPGSVGDANWQQMKEVLVDDRLNLNLKDWFERNNPYAYQDTTATMLEAIRKGYWNADSQTRQQLVEEYARSIARHGFSGSLRSGGNKALDELVRGELARMPQMAELLSQYTAQVKATIEAAPLVNLVAAPAAAPAPPGAAAPEASPADPTPQAQPPEAVQPPGKPANAQASVQGYRADVVQPSIWESRSMWGVGGLVGLVVCVLVGAWRRSGTPG